MSALASCQDSAKVKCDLAVSVVKDDGTPVEKADVSVRYPIGIKINPGGGFPTDRQQTTTVSTDTNGKAQINYKTVSSPEGIVWIKKDKFYISIFEDHQWNMINKDINNQYAIIKAVLKPIKNPIQMSSRLFENLPILIPSFGKDYGYDLELCEFVPPHGKGKHTDIIFNVIGSDNGKGKGQIQITIRGNGEKTGFVEFLTPKRERGSVLISDYFAPEDGYNNSLSFKFDSDNMAAAMNQPKDQNYYFRVRCQLNPDGTIKSCHYGKLYGPFTFWNIPVEQGGVASFGLHTSYFNPTPNDRNVEFDTKRNLLPDGNVQRP